MARIHLHPIGAEIDRVLSPDEIARNRAHMDGLEADLTEKIDTVHAGWGQRAKDRVHQKGKLTTWERIERLIDDGSEVFEVGTLVNWGREFKGSKRKAPGAGVVTCFARIHSRWCVIIANDNTVASGAWWPKTPEKIERAQEMALRLRLPVVYLVDCSGLFLPEQSGTFAGAKGAGHIFKQNARLADEGVPQVAGVFGDCIAGGGYMPIISDRVYMTENAYMVIAGAALIKGAKSQALTSLDIGGPEVHVHQSRCADVRVPDDPAAIDLIREEIARLPSSAAAFYRHGVMPADPRFEASDLGALYPADHRQFVEIEQVIARLVDDSLFHEVMSHVGREMVTGIARIQGLWVGIIANRQGIVEEPGQGRRPGGALYREGIAKIAQFSRACGEDGLPIVWLQDISGFDIGVEAERLGLLGYGSSLIYANATQQAPMFTILLRKASGAGFYAMAGMPYDPVVQLSTPITRLAVMEGRTLAIATYNSKLDDNFEIETEDPVERAAIEEGMAKTAARIETDMDPIASAARMDTDQVVPLGDLRAWLSCLVEAAWQSSGYRRTKNPRIWSMHDLEVLSAPGGTAVARQSTPAPAVDETIRSPGVGTWSPRIGLGAPLEPGMVLGILDRSGHLVEITAPKTAGGVALQVAAAGSWLSQGEALVTMGEGGGAVALRAPVKARAADVPDDVVTIDAETDGTIYLRPEPGSPLFAAEGATIAERDTIALVEVMKTFTPVRASTAGEVVRICVEDGASVRAGETLFWVRPV